MAKKRAAAYIRVSSESAGATHSYEFQEQYWRNKFIHDEEIELVGIYADKGISGSSIYKRPQFLMMMQDAREHRFDVIYTKSISRFSRNTVDFINAVRELRDIGIEVIFEKENIHTLQPTSELFMIIAASIAENDLLVDSERQRWSIKHRIENGWISIGNGMFGYRMMDDNQLAVVPEEAEIVREVFRRCLAGDGAGKIAAWLNAQGITTIKGKAWRAQAVLKMLHNEKYKGDSLMMKKVRRNGKSLQNTDGIYSQQYYIEDSHEGIVSKETWDRAQQVLTERSSKNTSTPDAVYPFTGIIECAKCGSHFVHKVNNSGQKWQTGIWTCSKRLRLTKSACDNTIVKDSVLEEKFIECYNEFVTKRLKGDDMLLLQSDLDRLYADERELAKLERQHLISDTAYQHEHKKLKEQVRLVTDKIASLRSKTVKESDYKTINAFDPNKVKKFVTKVMVSNGTLTFVFYNGARVTRQYTNGQPGNRPGWNRKEA